MRSLNIVALFCLFGGAAAQTCTQMYNGLTCRTASQTVDAGSLSGTRSWLCSSFPQYCSAINSGGQYASCSAAEQLSYAMNQYYSAYGPLQGSAACNFGGVGKIATPSSSSGSSGSSGSTSCTSMYNGLQCRTVSQNPALMDSAAISSSRTWLCSAYPNYCSDINNGGQYSSCNSAEQLSHAINRYYGDFKSQGASACNFGGIAQLVSSSGSTDNSCSTMFSSLKCRTTSQNVASLDSGKLNSARSWLCSAYPQHCSAINSGGQYASCNAAEQFSYAANQYYNQFSSQGASACDFSGVAKLVDGSSNSGNTGSSPSTTTASSAQCSSMYSAASCKTLSEDPSQIDTGAVAGSRSWLCGAYPQFCTAIVSGGAYTSCNVAQQMTYAMSLYYNQFQAQGSSACSFGGIAKLSSSIVVNPTPAPSQSSKAGLAWPIDQFHNGEAEPALAPWATGKISWIYTWNESPAPLPISSTNLEWVPMLHGSGGFNAFMGKINSGAFDNVKNILLFNEPDLDYPPYAYALDVNTAVQLSIQVFQAMNNRGKSWRIGTPAMSWNINWLQQYMGQMGQQCPSCKFSFVPIHSYTTDSNNFKATVQNYYNTFRLPVWVTEFADTDFANRNYQMSLQHIQQWMHDTTSWLNAQSWVERYSWFGTMRAVDVQDKQVMAMNRDGSRNTLGDQYVLRGGSL